MEIPSKMLRRNLEEIHYDIAHILVGGAPRQHDLGTSIAANSSFIMTSVFQNKGELEEPYFLLLKFSADIRQTFSIHSKKKKKVSLGGYTKSLPTHKNMDVNVVGRDPSEKRTHLLLHLVLFQHPLEIIWNYQNSSLWPQGEE